MKDRFITIRELANAAGVSIGTVSRALKNQPGLSEQTRNDVLRVANELGYDISRLRSSKPRRILFLYNRLHASLSANPFYSVVLNGVERACREANVSLSLLSVGAGDSVQNWIRRHEPNGLLCAGFFDGETLADIKSTELPTVLVDHFSARTYCVNDDNLQGARLITQHLIDQGYQRIAMISGPPTHNSVVLRQRGYRKALFDAGRLADPDLEVTLATDMPYEASAIAAMQRLLSLPTRPDAVFAYNDETALNALRACQQEGLSVPNDIAIAGYDDIEAAERSKPALTTVRVDKELLGSLAAQRLIDGELTFGEELLPVELVVRASTQRSH